MLKYVVKRIVLMIPVILGVATIIFFLLHFAPGDPARIILGDGASTEAVEMKREELGLNKPLVLQYLSFLKKTFIDLDFGNSYKTNHPVMEEIAQRYPTTMLLTAVGTLALILFGVPLGILSAVKHNTMIDRIATSISFVGVSMPEFWIALLLSMIFSAKLGWLPATGFYGPAYWILPAIAIALNGSANLMRMTRSGMLDVVRQDYIRTARAKGQTEKVIIWKHELKNSMIPIVTIMGFRIGALLGGSVVVESIFSIPGLGKYMLEAINNRDYAVVQGSVLVIAISFCVINLVVDLVYAVIDPRIKAQYQTKKKKEAAA